MPSRLPPRDCVPRPWRQSARVRAPLSRCVIARACGVPRTQDAYGLQRVDIARVLSVALSYVASSLVATPKNQRKPDSESLRSFAEQRYLARCVAPRDLSLLCCYSFLIQGKNTCENILQSVLQLGLLQKGAHISLVYYVHRPTDCLLPGP